MTDVIIFVSEGIGGDVFEKRTVERVSGECRGISQNNEFHAGTGYGNIHAAQII